MRIQLPDPGPGQHAVQLRVAFEAIRRALQPVVTSAEAAPALLLLAPDGSTWRVSVTTAGALQTEQVA